MITLEDVKNNEEVQELVIGAQKQLNEIGYTEHSIRHISIVSKRAGDILEQLGYPKERVELARIAGYLHDIGNCVNRQDHAQSGAILAYNILKEMGMPVNDRIEIMMAIGNHDEETGNPVSDISAALILADKSDVHRSRVVKTNIATFDIHDKVNYAVTDSKLIVDKENKKISLNIKIDTEICPVLNYFEIFKDRKIKSKKKKKNLKKWFELVIKDKKLL